MNGITRATVVTILAGITGALALPVLVARTPASVASTALGTEEAFSVSGLEPRENLVGGGAIRWTQPRAVFRFAGLEPGNVRIEVNARDHRGDVTVTANGARIGGLPKGGGHFESNVRVTTSELLIGLETDGFAASGRTLGTQFGSLVVTPESHSVASPLWLVFALVFSVALVASLVAELPVSPSILPPTLLAALVLPAGLHRSGWLFRCAGLLILATILSVIVARGSSGGRGAKALLAIALLLALTVHGVIPPSPLMIQGDAQFHGNRLQDVASGNLFITSQTQHHPPFRFPYGFSFYAVLAPFVSSSSFNVPIVRVGAALFSVMSILALALSLGRRSASLAATVALLWTFAPVNLRTMAFGNLSNVFAQAVFVLFLAGAMVRSANLPRLIMLAFLVGLSATSHLSSFIVIATLLIAAFFIRAERATPAFKPLLWGSLAAAAYYLMFIPSILSQGPRLLGERGGSAGAFDPLRLPNQVLLELGWPVIVLTLLALGLWRSGGAALPLSRSQAITGAALAVLAQISPIEVRYVLAFVPLIAVCAASGFGESLERPVSARTLLCAGLVAASVLQGAFVLRGFIPLWGGRLDCYTDSFQ